MTGFRLEIEERTMAAMQHEIHWQRVGNIADGYRLGVRGNLFEIDQREQVVLSTIWELRASRCTLRGIAAELNAGGWRTRRASSWRLEHVARILCPKTEL